MGLLSGLVLLPLAPVRGTIWVAERLAEHAGRELSEEAQVGRLLMHAQEEYAAGALTEAEYEQIEDQLLDRLELVIDEPMTGRS
jgi:uncharacterized membrane protein